MKNFIVLAIVLVTCVTVEGLSSYCNLIPGCAFTQTNQPNNPPQVGVWVNLTQHLHPKFPTIWGLKDYMGHTSRPGYVDANGKLLEKMDSSATTTPYIGGSGAPVSTFGESFGANDHSWTYKLCMEDSDNDGQSNGLELGDPCCAWWYDDIDKSGAVQYHTSGLSSVQRKWEKTNNVAPAAADCKVMRSRAMRKKPDKNCGATWYPYAANCLNDGLAVEDCNLACYQQLVAADADGRCLQSLLDGEFTGPEVRKVLKPCLLNNNNAECTGWSDYVSSCIDNNGRAQATCSAKCLEQLFTIPDSCATQLNPLQARELAKAQTSCMARLRDIAVEMNKNPSESKCGNWNDYVSKCLDGGYAISECGVACKDVLEKMSKACVAEIKSWEGPQTDQFLYLAARCQATLAGVNGAPSSAPMLIAAMAAAIALLL